MAEKFIKDEKGIVLYTTTSNLQLEKPLVSDNYDINVHNRNMDKIDTAINEVKGQVDGLELTSTKVIRPNKKTVEESLSANETSISNLKTKVDEGQNYKLTRDDGAYIEDASGVNIDSFFRGWKNLYNVKGTLPPGINPSDNNVIIECKGTDTNFIRQICYDVRSPRSWQRVRLSGSWNSWRSL